MEKDQIKREAKRLTLLNMELYRFSTQSKENAKQSIRNSSYNPPAREAYNYNTKKTNLNPFMTNNQLRNYNKYT